MTSASEHTAEINGNSTILPPEEIDRQSLDAFRHYIKQAQSLASQERWEDAVEQYKQALILNKKSPAWVYLSVGPLLIRLERIDEAISCYRQANALEPKSAKPYALMGVALTKKQLFSDAITSYSKALELDPNQPAWVHIKLGDLLSWRAKQDKQRATKNYLKAAYLQNSINNLPIFLESAEKVCGSISTNTEQSTQELGDCLEDSDYRLFLERLRKLKLLETHSSPINPASYYFINEKLKAVYCGIPKNACTLFKTAWVKNSEEEDSFKRSGQNVHVYLNRRSRSLSANYLLECLSSKEYFKFVILRNPFDRIVSGYLDKIAKHAVPESFAQDVIQAVHRSLGKDFNLEKSITFSQFVDYLVSTPDNCLNDHWRPQSNFVLGVNFDLVAQFSSLESAISSIQKKLGITIDSKPCGHATTYKHFEDKKDFHHMYPHELRTLGAFPTPALLCPKPIKDKLYLRFIDDVKLFEHHFKIIL